MRGKSFGITLYDQRTELEVQSWLFDTKVEQLAKYYELLASGHLRTYVEKSTYQR